MFWELTFPSCWCLTWLHTCFVLHIEYTGPNIVSFIGKDETLLEADYFRKMSKTFNLASVWQICQEGKKTRTSKECHSKANIPCPVLPTSLTCTGVCVCVCVTARLCVRGKGCLFCLPLSIALSCPLLLQQRKEPRPSGLGLVYLCGVSLSWDSRSHLCSLLHKKYLFTKNSYLQGNTHTCTHMSK